MTDDLSARLREMANLKAKAIHPATILVSLLNEAADALDAAPPRERVLPEGVTWERCSQCAGKGGWQVGFPVNEWTECPNCDETGVVTALAPDSATDPEPKRVVVDFADVEPQHSPLRTWPTDPEPQL